MRVSLKRGLQWVCALVLLQLAVYYWSVSVKRSRKARLIKPHKYLKPLRGDDGVCSFKTCPDVKPGMLNVHFVPHSHIDVGWLKTVDQYYEGSSTGIMDGHKMPLVEGCVRCTIEATLKELKDDPTRRFIFVEMKYLSRFWREANDETRAFIRQLIKERRLEIINGGWVMSDAGVTWYNDIIDQHTLGADFISETFGPCAQSRTAWHVDQFGHSREHASIFAQMGYDSLFVGRIDFQDLAERKRTKNLEFLWDTSPDNLGGRNQLFTQTTFDGYYAPPRYVYETAMSDEVPEQESAAVYNFVKIMHERARTFATNHLLVPMGSDFGYVHASRWFQNMDRLIKFINKQHNNKEGMRMNILYSTPSCYTYHVNRDNATFESKTDDFHPYGIEPGVYWTGYFTTRGGMKLHVKRAGQILQSCKQLSIFKGLDGTFHKINVLRDILAVMQHHDAITGTQKKHVLSDYNKLLSEGTHQCETVMSMAYQRMWTDGSQSLHLPPTSVFCHGLNMSTCAVSEKHLSQFVVSLYNPLGWPVTTWLRLPVPHTGLTITDHRGSRVSFQLCPVPEGVMKIPERNSHTDTEVVFPALLPPMSVTPFQVKIERGGPAKPVLDKPSQGKGVTIENEFLKLTFDRSGLLTTIYNKVSHITEKVSQDLLYYEGMQGGMRSSGAYVFIPSSATTKRVSKDPTVSIKVLKGDLVQEVHQVFSSWATQVVRLYKGENYAEFQWTVGPISDSDGKGKEVVSRFSTGIDSGDLFYTDSNGREMMERQRDARETWDYQPKDLISGNYYPITSRILIKDQQRNVQLTVLPDRPQGGGSISSGDVELMVHRKLRFDDGLGVGEPLDDFGSDYRGIVFTGKHWLCLDTKERSAELVKRLAYQLHMAPATMFTPTGDEDSSSGLLIKQQSFLTSPLPDNVHILTLDRIGSNDSSFFLLRLEHVFEKKEHPVLSLPATVSLENLFQPFDIATVEETTLGGNFRPHDISRLQWETTNGRTPAKIGSPDYRQDMVAPFKIKLEPMEIRTFRVQTVPNS